MSGARCNCLDCQRRALDPEPLWQVALVLFLMCAALLALIIFGSALLPYTPSAS